VGCSDGYVQEANTLNMNLPLKEEERVEQRERFCAETSCNVRGPRAAAQTS
jgi:hypothetical protein